MNASNPEKRSRIALLGTMAELHQEIPAYDLRVLRDLVKEMQPDLLLAEIHPEDWQAGELNRLSLEYRDALVPLSRRTDIVIVPVSGSRGWELGVPQGTFLSRLRTFAVRLLNRQIRWMQRLANGPGVVNSGWFGWMCDRICTLIAWICGPQAQREWDQSNQVIVDNVCMAIGRDPGRRVLVTVDCRRRHRLERALRRLPEVELVDYRHL
jgi:hypothetical protein